MTVSGISSANVSSSTQATQGATKKIDVSGSRIAVGKSSGGAAKPAAASGNSSSSQSTTYDKKDANKDGVVSALEELTYDLEHPSGEADGHVDVTA